MSLLLHFGALNYEAPNDLFQINYSCSCHYNSLSSKMLELENFIVGKVNSIFGFKSTHSRSECDKEMKTNKMEKVFFSVFGCCCQNAISRHSNLMAPLIVHAVWMKFSLLKYSWRATDCFIHFFFFFNFRSLL